jgi:L-ascorbate metabolism protein UlaG (beta-lactamase superfamily)
MGIERGMTKLERAKKYGRKFLNPVPTRVGGLSLMFKALPLYLQNREETEPKRALGPFRTDRRVYERAPQSGVRVTWFGHSSELVEIDGVTVLIDPVWDDRAAPVSFMGPKRFFAPTLPLDELPALDAVLISHDHYDHLGKQTVRKLAKMRPDLRWVCPPGVAKDLHGFGVAAGRVTELDWTQETVVRGQVGEEMKVTAVPGRHFSGRSLANRFETLWAGYVLAGSQHKVYYGADSGFWDGFAAIGAAYGPFDLTMLEIGAFHELWREIHLGPDGAVQAYEALGAEAHAGVLMPIHWGLFNLAMHAWRQPIERISQLAAEKQIKLFVPEPGKPTEFKPGKEVRTTWWRASR